MPPTPAIAPSATQQLLHALAERPDASAAELADAAGIGRSTASKLLAILAAQGRVLRRPGGHDGGRRTPDRWTLITTTSDTSTDSSAARVVSGDPIPAAAGGDPPVRPAGRLRAGELRDQVVGCLAQRPGQPLSPTAIARTLDRSAGAVANALRVLAGQGRVVQTQAKPRRYRLAGPGDPTAPTD